ncbi:MAG: TetR/AcrR family transcriptional regulator [Acidimicrobiales bacterium]
MREVNEPGRARRRYARGEGGHLRDDILDAAAHLLVETGDEAMVTMRAVAAAVGVSPPSVYLHFPDKDTLIFAVCQKLFTALDDAVEAATRGLSHPLERLKARGLAYARFGVEHPEQYRVIFMQKSEAAPEAFGSVQLMESAAFGHLLQDVVDLLETGEMLPGLEAFPVAIECWAVVHGCTSLLISHPTLGLPPVDALVGQVCDHLARGMLAADP